MLPNAGPKAVLPIDGPWRHSSLKAFIRNVDAGKEETGKCCRYQASSVNDCCVVTAVCIQGCDVDCQIDGITKLAPVVAAFAGKPEMLEKVEKAVRVTQNNDMCVAVTLAAARSGGQVLPGKESCELPVRLTLCSCLTS